MCVCVCVWLQGDRGEQGDKGATGYGLPGYMGDQGPNGKTTDCGLMIDLYCRPVLQSVFG